MHRICIGSSIAQMFLLQLPSLDFPLEEDTHLQLLMAAFIMHGGIDHQYDKM